MSLEDQKDKSFIKAFKTLKELIDEEGINVDTFEVRLPSIRYNTGYTQKDTSKHNSLEYIQQANKYLKESKDQNLNYLDSISNSQRAIKRRYDEILDNVLDIKTLLRENKKEFEILNDLNIYIPDLIKDYIVDPRIQGEHLFSKKINKDNAKMAFEVAYLFIKATDEYLMSNTIVPNIVVGNFLEEPWYFNTPEEGFEIKFLSKTDKRAGSFLFEYYKNGKNTGSYFFLSSKNPLYLEMIYLINSFKYEKEKINISKNIISLLKNI